MLLTIITIYIKQFHIYNSLKSLNNIPGYMYSEKKCYRINDKYFMNEKGYDLDL